MTRSCSVWNLIIYSNACTCGGIFSRNCLKADTWTQLKTCFLSYLSEEWILLDTLELLRACILYSQIIFSQKNKKKCNTKQVSECRSALWAASITSRSRHPIQGESVSRKSCDPQHPLPCSGSHSCHPSCTNRSMSSPCPWLACAGDKPSQPTFPYPLAHLFKRLSGTCKAPQSPPAPTDTTLGSGGDFMSPFPN